MKKNSILMVALLGIGLSSLHASEISLRPVNGKSVKVAEAAPMKAETWEFYLAQEEPTPADLAALNSSHKLGKRVAFLYDSFKETYVVKEEVVPGDPTRRTVIRKPDIYNAVRMIEKELNRQVRKEEITEEKAETELTNVLKVALAAIDSDTDSFESALQENKKDASQLLNVFHRVHLLSIY